jgi:hypothetical protein
MVADNASRVESAQVDNVRRLGISEVPLRPGQRGFQ